MSAAGASCGTGDHDAVVASRSRPGDLSPGDVPEHQRHVAVQRISPAAPARGPDPDQRPGRHRLCVGERVCGPLILAAWVDHHLERTSGLPAVDPPAGQDRTVRDRHEVAVGEHPDDLLVAKAAAELPGPARVGRQPESLDDEREPGLGELGRQVPRVRDDMDGVLAVGVVAAAGTAAEHLAHQVRLTCGIGAVDAGVPDRLLVGRHPPADRLGQHAGQHAEQPQDHERAGVRGGGEDRREQRPGWRKPHLDQIDHALVDVQLGHPFRRVSEVSQDRRQPFGEEVAVGVVAAVIDRPLGLRARAMEVQDQLRAVRSAGVPGVAPLASRVIGRPGQRDALGVQPGRVHAVVLGVVLPGPGADRDLREDLAAERRRGAGDDRVEAGLDGAGAVPLEQLGEPSGAHQARSAFGVEVGGE